MKIIKTTYLIVTSLAILYCLAVFFVTSVCWVTGNPPQHLLPGMNPYAEWKFK